MIKISQSFNAEERKILISVETSLLSNYYNNFCGLIKGLDINEIEVTKNNKNIATISFPVDKNQNITSMKKISDDKISIGVDISKISKKIEDFVNAAIRQEYRTVEFIPLEGYPIENLQIEINEAIKCRRKFCIVKNYDEYLNGNNTGQPKYHQYMISPEDNKSEYSDVALLVHNGDIETLRKIYKHKLKLEEWC